MGSDLQLGIGVAGPPSAAELPQRVLGLDIGIASIGWALLQPRRTGAGCLIAAGVYAFDAPEEKDSRGNVAASNRKRHGDMQRRRRQVGRRALRMTQLRKLLCEHQPPILEKGDSHALGRALHECARAPETRGITPWQLREEGLHRILNPKEWAVTVGHIVGHRAYLSNAKRRGNNDDAGGKTGKEQKKVLEEIKKNDATFSRAVQAGEVETIGEWLGRSDRQRNRAGDYQHSIRREWVVDEAKLLFVRQRTLGSTLASPELQDKVIPLIRDQREITSKPVGECTFEPGEPRAARHSYSFELFRLLQRLNNVRIISDRRTSPRLNAEEIKTVTSKFGAQQTITYKTLRGCLELQEDEKFNGVPDKKAEQDDVVARKGKGVPGTFALRKVITKQHGMETWQSLLDDRDKLDGIAAAIAHVDALSKIRERLSTLGLDAPVIDTLVQEADGGQLGFFKGTGHLSLKALRKLEPHLRKGGDYYESQLRAGYDPSKDRFSRKPGIAGDGPVAVRRWLRG